MRVIGQRCGSYNSRRAIGSGGGVGQSRAEGLMRRFNLLFAAPTIPLSAAFALA